MRDHPPDIQPGATACARDATRALTPWENEGGADPATPAAAASLPIDAEAEQLRVRVIALENLVIALLADATRQQRTLACDMGDFISPRPGHTRHPMTLRAAEAMRSLVDRADRFRAVPPP
jgi:hypothetical protein